MLKYIKRISITTVLVIASLTAVRGELNPEIQLGAIATITTKSEIEDGDYEGTTADYSDSSLNIGFRQALYGNFRSQLVIGFQLPEPEPYNDIIFFDNVFIKINDRANTVKIGRSRVNSTLIEFPTFREDDTASYTDVLNPLTFTNFALDSQYGNTIMISRLFGQRLKLSVHGENMNRTPVPGMVPLTPDRGFNAWGLSFDYSVPESQLWDREILNYAGVGFFGYYTDRGGHEAFWNRTVKNVLIATEINVLPDPVHFIKIGHQSIYNPGFYEFTSITSENAETLVESLSSYTSLVYQYRRYERPTFQISAGFGYKTFPGLDISSDKMFGLANLRYRIGENFDVGLQYGYEKFKGDLDVLYGNELHTIELGLIYSIDQSWNDQFDDHDSLLNLEHGYIP